MPPIFCPTCATLILDAAACLACGWQRPREADDAGTVVWRAELGRALPKPPCSAVIAGGRYCVSAEDGTIVALDLATGQPEWERALDLGHATHTLATDGTLLLVSSADAQPIPVAGRPLLALDARTGVELWRYPTGAHSLSEAALAGGVAYFSTSDGQLHAVESASGRQLWTAPHAAWGPSAPTCAQAVVCAGGRGETLIGYAASDGTERWRFTATGWFAGALLLVHQRVYAACWDGHLYVLHAQTGQLLWEYQGERGEGITSSPTVAGDRVFIGSRVYRDAANRQGNGYALLALRAEDGVEIWRFVTEKRISTPVSISGDLVLFGVEDGSFIAADTATGAERWRIELNGRSVTQPQLAGDLAYIGERHGSVYAIRWRAQPQERLQSAAAYVSQGEYEQAAIASALSGDLATAAAIYERQLDRPKEAAQLYEHAGQPGKAASLAEAAGDLRRARDLYQQSGDLNNVARMHDRMGEPLQAAKLYQEIGQPDLAAQLYEQAGDRVKAADLYREVGRYGQAALIWASLGKWEQLIEDLAAGGRPAEAARILEQHDQFERAADLYEAADQLQPALRLRVELQHWERAANLAFRSEDYVQEARAHEQLGRIANAAEAYERAAKQSLARTPINEEQIAAYYEQAADHYSTLFDEEQAARCRSQVRRYRHLPAIAVAGGAQHTFVEYEWNSLKLRIRNNGHGPAINIVTTLRGNFDTSDNGVIAMLAAKRSVTLDLSLRPQHKQYGPAVPLEILVSYADTRGVPYTVSQRIPVRVMQQGVAFESTTPLAIDFQSEPPPTRAKRTVEATPTPADTDGSRAASVHDKEIKHQQRLLARHRRTVAHLVEQAAKYGGESFVPPQVVHGLDEARDNIRRIKRVLRDWDVTVADHPDDERSTS